MEYSGKGFLLWRDFCPKPYGRGEQENNMEKDNYADRHTFVVCAYKESPYIESCIMSLLGQTINSTILISTSTDNAYIRKIAEKYGIPLYVSDNIPDIAGDWNFAYRQAQTEYVTLVHQDDIYAPDYVKIAVQKLSSVQKPLMFFSDYYELRNGRNVYINTNLLIKKILLLPMRAPVLRGSRLVKKASLSFGNPICCPSVTFAKRNLPYVLFRKGMKSNIDWEAWLTVARMSGEFVYCPSPLMGHRIHSESTTTAIIESLGRTEEDLAILQKIWPAPIAGLINRVYRNSEQSNRQ